MTDTGPKMARIGTVRSREGVWILAGDVMAAAVAIAVSGHLMVGTVGCALAFFVLVVMNGTYRRPRVSLAALSDMKATLATAAVPIVLAGVASSLSTAHPSTIRFGAAFLPAIAVGRVASYQLVKTRRRRGHCIEPAVILGSGRTVDRFTEAFERKPELGLRLVGYVEQTADAGQPLPHLGRVEDLDAILREHHVRRLIVGFSEITDTKLVALLREIRTRPLEVFVVPRLHEWGSASGDMRTQDCAGTPIVWLPHREWRREQLAMKRLSDIVLAASLMILAAPVMAAAAIAVKLTSPGPLLFRQNRVGKDGVVFEMLKLRTMRELAPGETHGQSGGGDPRITRVGKWLRRTSLDELPQLYNVLRGDMSMVGPRPEAVAFAFECGDKIEGYADRHRVRVGLTGWAQINQLRGVGTSLEERARYDNYYIEHWSIWRDVAIVLRTVTAALRGS